MEDRADRQAADAVRARSDWQDALALDLPQPGFDHTVDGAAAGVLLDRPLARCQERGLLKAGGRQRTDSTPVLAAGHARNRLDRVRQTLRHVLDVVAVAASDWLRAGPARVGRARPPAQR